MYHSIFKRCVTDQPIQFKPLIHIVGDFVFYDVTVKSNHIAVLPSLSVSSAQPLSKLNARADFPGIGYAPHRSSHLLGLQFREVFYTVTNIRTPQRTVSSMQRFAVSQKNRTEAITTSPVSRSLPCRSHRQGFSPLKRTKADSIQPKPDAVCLRSAPVYGGRFRNFFKLPSVGTREGPFLSYAISLCKAPPS